MFAIKSWKSVCCDEIMGKVYVSEGSFSFSYNCKALSCKSRLIFERTKLAVIAIVGN